MKPVASFAALSCQNEKLTLTYLCFPHTAANATSLCYNNQMGTYQAALLPTRNMMLLSTAGKRKNSIKVIL